MVIRKKQWLFITLLIAGQLFWQCAGSPGRMTTGNLSRIESRNIQVDSTFFADPVLEAFIEPYREDLDKQMSVVIGYAAVELYKGKPEAPLNNFVADLMLKRANLEFDQTVQIALTNLGGLRVEIPPGPITRGKIYELMPFENELVVLPLTGVQIITLAKEIGLEGGEAISGMTLEYQDTMLAKIKATGTVFGQ